MKKNNLFPKIKDAEKVEIISLVDNSVDFLSTSPREEVKVFREWAKGDFHHPIAEHGFSMLIRAFNGDKLHSVLFDTGSSPRGVIINARRMGIDLAEVECIVLSHGHYDHFTGLPAVARVIGKSDMPIIVHRDMFNKRGTIGSDGTIRKYPIFPSEEKVKPARYVEVKQPYLIADGLILVTGEIPRKTQFEKGYPRHVAFINGKWRPDPWIWDDRALVIKVKGKGLIVICGCSHAGVVNTIAYAQQLTGVETVYAVLGGFHLAGRTFEKRINETVKELKKINPKLLAPSHCTGWRANITMSKAMPEAFIWNSVGNLYKL